MTEINNYGCFYNCILLKMINKKVLILIIIYKIKNYYIDFDFFLDNFNHFFIDRRKSIKC